MQSRFHIFVHELCKTIGCPFNDDFFDELFLKTFYDRAFKIAGAKTHFDDFTLFRKLASLAGVDVDISEIDIMISNEWGGTGGSTWRPPKIPAGTRKRFAELQNGDVLNGAYVVGDYDAITPELVTAIYNLTTIPAQESTRRSWVLDGGNSRSAIHAGSMVFNSGPIRMRSANFHVFWQADDLFVQDWISTIINVSGNAEGIVKDYVSTGIRQFRKGGAQITAQTAGLSYPSTVPVWQMLENCMWVVFPG